MKIIFIRHGFTAGNTEKRYIGRTDEPLCDEGKTQLSDIVYPTCDVLFCSPMKRCTETAKIIYPDMVPIIANDMRECDFGDFEGKNYKELSGNADYQRWIDSGGELPFPNGENPRDFRERCCNAFADAVKTISADITAAFVVHGGTIMSVLEKYAVPHREYFDWHCENGHGFICNWDGQNLKDIEKI